MKLPIYLLALTSAFLHAQGGSLTPPPGSPAPTMKSLDQVEARTPLIEGATGVSITPGSGNITINQSGSYYLAGNLTVTGGNAITITANFVTLDLNGFTITSNAEPASGNGIFILGSDVTISRGNITGSYDVQENSGTGFGTGIKSTEDGPIEIQHVKVSNCAGDGINIGRYADNFNTVTSCFVRNVEGAGIIAVTVERCGVKNTGGDGIDCDSALHCKVSTDNGIGIKGDLISHCRSHSYGTHGIKGLLVNNSMGGTYHGTGIEGQAVSHCFGSSSEGTSIRGTKLVTFSDTYYGGNIMGGHFAISAPMAVGCPDGIHLITNEFLMP